MFVEIAPMHPNEVRLVTFDGEIVGTPAMDVLSQSVWSEHGIFSPQMDALCEQFDRQYNMWAEHFGLRKLGEAVTVDQLVDTLMG